MNLGMGPRSFSGVGCQVEIKSVLNLCLTHLQTRMEDVAAQSYAQNLTLPQCVHRVYKEVSTLKLQQGILYFDQMVM